MPRHLNPSARLYGGVCALAMTLICVPVPISAQDTVTPQDAARQLKERKRALDAARGKEDRLKLDLNQLEKERAELNEKLIATGQRVQASEARLTEVEQRLGQLQEQETGVRQSIRERHGDIAKLLSAMQRIGGDPPPALVARRDDALKMVRSAMLMASIFPELKFQADSLADDLSDLVRLGEGIRKEEAAERIETKKLKEEQQHVSGLLEEKKSRQALSRETLAKVRAAAKRHAREVIYLGELLERMKKELAKAESGLAKYEKELVEAKARQAREREAEAAKAAREPAEVKPEKKKQYAFLSPGRIKPAISFDEVKGALPRPAQGKTFLNFGETAPRGGTSQGQWVRTRYDARIVSPADGWIVYAGDFRSYGELLIIDAGGGYHILLAGMKHIDAEVGQFVLASEPVAVMGASASQKKAEKEDDLPALYIEFRKDGRPINPTPWWAEIPEKVQG